MKYTQGWSFVARLVCVATLAMLLIAGFVASAEASGVRPPVVSVASGTSDVRAGNRVRDAVGARPVAPKPDSPAAPDPGTGAPSVPEPDVDTPAVPTSGGDPGTGKGSGVGSGSGRSHDNAPGTGTSRPRQPSQSTGHTGASSRPDPSRSGGPTNSDQKKIKIGKHVNGTISESGITAGDSSDGDENITAAGAGAVQSGEISAQLMSAASTFGWSNLAVLLGLTVLWAAWQVFRFRRDSGRRRTAGNPNATFLAALPAVEREPSFSELIAR